MPLLTVLLAMIVLLLQLPTIMMVIQLLKIKKLIHHQQKNHKLTMNLLKRVMSRLILLTKMPHKVMPLMPKTVRKIIHQLIQLRIKKKEKEITKKHLWNEINIVDGNGYLIL